MISTSFRKLKKGDVADSITEAGVIQKINATFSEVKLNLKNVGLNLHRAKKNLLSI